MLDERGRTHMIDNIVEHLQQCTDKDIIRRSVAVFAQVDDDFGRRLAEKLKIDVPSKVCIEIFLYVHYSFFVFFCFL